MSFDAITPMSDVPAPSYYSVIQTDLANVDHAAERALRLMAILAEESPDFIGYEVEETADGEEFAVTYWRTPKSIDAWKRAVAILVEDGAVVNQMFGKQGCRWPWMGQSTAAGVDTHLAA